MVRCEVNDGFRAESDLCFVSTFVVDGLLELLSWYS